jgi:hypothetical protein
MAAGSSEISRSFSLDFLCFVCEHVYVNMIDEHVSQSVTTARGGAVWAHVHVPVVSPENWFIHEHHDALIELERIRRELDAATAMIIGSLPDSRDTVANLSRTCGISNSEARRRRDIANVVTSLPEAGVLLSRGDISEEHVRALTTVLDQPGADELAGVAVGMSPEDFVKHVKEFRLSREHGEDVAKRQRSLRSLRFFDGPDGMIGLKGLLPPIEGMDLKTRLTALIDAKYRHDHPERAETVGGHHSDPLDQRMADALLELTGIKEFTNIKQVDINPVKSRTSPTRPTASPTRTSPTHTTASSSTASATNTAPTINDQLHDDRNTGRFDSLHDPPKSPSASPSNEPWTWASGPAIIDSITSTPAQTQHRGRYTPLTVKTGKHATIVVMNVDTWTAELLGHGPIPVTASLFDKTKADLFFMFENMKGETLKFGRAQKHPSIAQQLAVLARDQHCSYPGCHTKHDLTEIHHINEWFRDQGFTDIELLALFCRAHHKHLHLNNLKATRQPNGTIIIIDRTTNQMIATATNRT